MPVGDPVFSRPAPTAKNDLTVNEVTAIALVPSGDNPDAEIVLVKADPRNPTDGASAAEVSGMPTNPSNATGAPPEGGDPQLDTTTLLKVLEEVQKQNALLVQQNEAIVKALEEDDFEDPEDPEDGDGEDGDGEDADPEPEVAKGKKVAKAAPAADGDVEDLIKSSPVLKAMFDKQAAQIAELSSAVTKADQTAETERNARLDVEFAKRAEALAPLGMDQAEMASTMRKAFDQLDVDTYLAIEKALAHAASILDENNLLTEEVGKGDPEGGYGTKFEELLAKSGGQGAADGQTAEQRLAAAFRADPDIYAELTTAPAATSNGRTSR